MGTQFQSVTCETLDFASLFPNLNNFSTNSTFSQCVNLKTLTLPATFIAAREGVFGSYSSGKTVIIGNVTEGSLLDSVGWNCFNYATVVLFAATPPTKFGSHPSDAIWYVPDESLDLYLAKKAASGLKCKFKPMSEWEGA